jgi:hypothetical protein
VYLVVLYLVKEHQHFSRLKAIFSDVADLASWSKLSSEKNAEM